MPPLTRRQVWGISDGHTTGLLEEERMPSVEEVSSSKLDDFYRDPSYERRVVIFYDVLGWRNQISAAGTDTKKNWRIASGNSPTRSIYAVATRYEITGNYILR